MHLIELSPNCSLTPRTAAWFYVSVLAVCLPIAIGCTLAGFWPVLPFAGLELMGLGAALYISMKRGRDREFVRVDEREVVVGRASDGQQELYRFPRPWTRVQLLAAGTPNWPSKLLLGCMGRMVEIGSFLTEPERERLRDRLTELIGTPQSRAAE